MKYRVGDRIIVKKGISDDDCKFGLCVSMQKFLGSVATIKEVGADFYRLEDDGCKWTDGCFVGLKNEEE